MMYNDIDSMPVLKQHKEYLKTFWSLFGNVGARFRWAGYPKDEVIDMLIHFGTIDLHYRSPTHTRQDWDIRKNKVKKFMKFEECFACGGRCEVRHHIIWLSRGGRNQKNNIIGLCKPCHAKIHPWLKS